MKQDFYEWCVELNKLSKKYPERYGPNAIESCGEEMWLCYYEDGYSPKEAWEDDIAYD